MSNATEKLTHNLQVWINNDEGLIEQLNEIAKAQELDLYETAKAFKDFFTDEELWRDYSKLNSVHKELLDIAIAFINWQGIASDMIEQIQEEAKV